MNPLLASPSMIAAIAAGGAAGSVLRFMVGLLAGQWLGTAFPWGTLAINIVGSFVIGALTEIFALHWEASQTMRAFLVIGLCGGFTTFSTFALDAAVLIERGDTLSAIAYSAGSVLAGLGALYAAMALVRHIAG